MEIHPKSKESGSNVEQRKKTMTERQTKKQIDKTEIPDNLL